MAIQPCSKFASLDFLKDVNVRMSLNLISPIKSEVLALII